jgi:hypothetical protein
MESDCPLHGVSCKYQTMKANYSSEVKEAKVHFLPNEEFDPIIFETFPGKYSRIRLKFTRGFTKDGEIYIRENTWIGLKKLIKHEFGHLYGLKHTLNVTLMNRYWIFRWFNRPKLDLI